MSFRPHRFRKDIQVEFTKTLRKRVMGYFQENNISRNANAAMVFKTVVMFTLFFGPLALMLTGVVTHPLLILACWLVMGLGSAGIGLSVMHDSVHGSYSSNRRVNKALSYSLNLIGASQYGWRMQHNVLHHSFTNIAHADDDIHTPGFLRFSPHIPLKPMHRWQHIYVWFFYGISTFWWVTVKDFVQLTTYYKRGLVESKAKYRSQIVANILWKLFYFSYVLVLPMILLPISPLAVLGCFMAMHFVLGIILSTIFQPAHVVPSSEFLDDAPPEINENWTVHQLLTTSNFAPKNRLLTWFAGGLNYQVEHHLFPHICHIHYTKISGIVKETAEEYGLPYYSMPTFRSALSEHMKMLYTLGRQPKLQPVRAQAQAQAQAA